ncbi:hypothetical protein EYB53_019710 [Candidatus Chloroploca sp. M-50]|uniref:ATP-binding protein n=1 Tax=Candidatus Chloroploca mongolica TaxID=2528176 RepID=A0ABS4DEV1_9CHLR|nr:hypothetical protein [Candidatus Chloroploca mongolica]MBP1467953.1 hypothetical protein [Candidatus Chloroploca mongolica]
MTAQSTPHFVNRDNEIRRIITIVRSDIRKSTLINAPSGFGKSALLEKVIEKLQGEHRDYAYALVSAHSIATIEEIARLFLQEFKIPESEDLPKNPGRELARCLNKRFFNSNTLDVNITRVVLIVDFDVFPEDINKIIVDFISDIRENLKHLEKSPKVDLIVAGKILKTVELLSYPELVTLSPLTYEHVYATAAQYLRGHHSQAISEAAAHVFYLTGGHPQCMAALLNALADSRDAPDIYFDPKSNRQHWDTQIQPVFEKVEREIPSNLSDFADVITALSVYRYLDNAILTNHCDSYPLTGCPTCEDLKQKLTAAYIYPTNNRGVYLCDGVYRRLLTIKLRYEQPERLRTLCETSATRCLEKIATANEPKLWALEYLFQRLQVLSLEPLEDAADRQAALEGFLFDEVKQVVDALYQHQRNWHDFTELVALVTQQLSQPSESDQMGHWELSFLFNYVFREKAYNEELIRKLTHALEQERDRYRS